MTVIRSNGEPVALRGYLLDITKHKKAAQEKRQLEERLRQAQKMESIGTLAGGIAHDFNNILAPIFGYAELAKMLPPSDSENDSLVEFR